MSNRLGSRRRVKSDTPISDKLIDPDEIRTTAFMEGKLNALMHEVYNAGLPRDTHLITLKSKINSLKNKLNIE